MEKKFLINSTDTGIQVCHDELLNELFVECGWTVGHDDNVYLISYSTMISVRIIQNDMKSDISIPIVQVNNGSK